MPVPVEREEERFLALIPMRRRPLSWRSKLLLVLLALVCFTIGVLTLPLPVPSPFWLAGFVVLGVAVPPVARWVNRQEAKLSPKWRRRLRPKLWAKGRKKLQQLD